MEEKVEEYQFQIIDRPIPTLKEKENVDLLVKWNLDQNLKIWTFSFDKAFHPYNVKGFAHDFLRNPSVMSLLSPVVDTMWSKDVGIEQVNVDPLNCSVTSMNFFERLKEEKIVRQSGAICKCFDETYEGILISDELRKMILSEDCINFEVFSDDDRLELMFRLFKMFVIGGPICQYEDNIDPYLNITKSLYKDLVCVQKNPNSEELIVISKVVQLSIVNEEKKKQVFPSGENEQNFAFLIIDPLKRHAHLLHCGFGKGFW